MRYTQLLIPTIKEVPTEAEIASHKLMIRAGFIRKLASGTYSYLPLGWRSLLKIMNIVRQEMDAAGAQEVSLPILQPLELWRKTGRDVVFEEILFSFRDHHGRSNALAPTAEEVVTSLVAAEVSSYKQLPINLYQINAKFRDEFRPRFGVLRSREFLMKDAYSFDATPEGLDVSYRKMYDAYRRIFDRCGLEYVVVEAESGGMGGSDTEEFMVLSSAGEDVIVHTEDYSYAANIEKAAVDPLPRADFAEPVEAVKEVHTPGAGTIEEVCGFLGTSPGEMIKTLIFTAPGEMHQGSKRSGGQQAGHDAHKGPTAKGPGFKVVAALVRGDHDLNETKLAGILGAEGVQLASPETIRDVTEADVGFAGPMGLASKVEMLVVDHAVAAMAAGVCGANRTDYHVRNVVPGRDFPLEGENVFVADIRNAAAGDTHEHVPLHFSRGIEIGHVFKLGAKYSRALGCTFLDETGAERPCVMGCYGIGINRILAAAIETGHDANGCVLPVNIAPFEVEILPLNNDSQAVTERAGRIHQELIAAGADVLLDDRDVRPGVKFKDADLIGIPLRVVVGERGLKEGKVEIKRRTDERPTLVDAARAVAAVLKIRDEMKQS